MTDNSPHSKPREGAESWEGAEPTPMIKSRPTTPATQPSAPIAASAQWEGAEPTLPPSSWKPVDKPVATPVAKTVGSEKPAAPLWDGDEDTSASLPHQVNRDRWDGDDATKPHFPSAPAEQQPLAADVKTKWAGDDATVPNLSSASALSAKHTRTGTPESQAATKPETNVGTTVNRARTTSVFFDDAWHMEGRQGSFTGQEWGDWLIGGMLGEGGMGVVYRGKQISLKRRVAIKVLSPNLAANQDVLHRFQLEARMTSVLSSPNVVQVFAAGEWEGHHFFVMEFVEGTDLYYHIRERQSEGKPITPDEAADIVIQAAKGLAEAGRYGIVHRDIKPPNLMVTKQGLVKVADFGIVKVLGESSLTMAGQSVGTPAYISPEQGRGAADIDQRSDLYSLGVVFYELLCGKKPFEATTPNALIYQHCYIEPDLPRTVNPAVSEAYQAVVLKCLQKKPRDRYDSADALITDLEAIRNGNMLQSALANYRIGTGADDAQRENMSWTQRNLMNLVGAAVMVLLIAGGLGLWYNKYHQDLLAKEAGERQRAGELFAVLSTLDAPNPIPANVDSDLNAYAASQFSDQKKIMVWRKKIDDVGKLRAQLTPLDQNAVPLATRLSATSDLRDFENLVGTKDPSSVRWRNKVDGLIIEEETLRQQLRGFVDSAAITQSLIDGNKPLLEKLRTMVGENDDTVIRVTRRFKDFDARNKILLGNLAVLDKSDVVITETLRIQLQADHAALVQNLGNQDERLNRWGIKLISNGEQVKKLRERLRRLDQYDLPPVVLQLELKKDFAALQELVNDSDPELRGWKSKIVAAEAEVVSLRERLALLAKVKILTLSHLYDAENWNKSLEKLVGPGDAEVESWRKRISAVHQQIKDFRITVARIERDETPTADALARITLACAQLDAHGALTPAQKADYTRRIDSENSWMLERRQRLTEFDRVASVTAEQRRDLAILTKQIGEQDADIKRWRDKLTIIDALRLSLSTLDQRSQIPANVPTLLRDYIALVGHQDGDGQRWEGKLKRILELKTNLKSIDEPVPLPANAAENLSALRQEVGNDDADIIRWQDEYNDVQMLTPILNRLETIMVLSANEVVTVRENLTKMQRLVGKTPNWNQRFALLVGPGRPAWASEAGHDHFGPYADLVIADGVTQRFRYIPPGRFIMGSPADEMGHDKSETQVAVTISRAFWLAESECTQAAWNAIMDWDISRERGELYPVQRVSWHDSVDFCRRLGEKKPDLLVRLPSEAEWEYACRAGSTGAIPSIGSASMTGAWFEANAGGACHKVKQRSANLLGLHDMLGNVAEWCEDSFAPYPGFDATDPVGKDGDRQVARGGSWGDSAQRIRSADRIPARPDMRSAYVGFRLATTVVWPAGMDPGYGSTTITSTVYAHEVLQLNFPFAGFRILVRVLPQPEIPASQPLLQVTP